MTKHDSSSSRVSQIFRSLHGEFEEIVLRPNHEERFVVTPPLMYCREHAPSIIFMDEIDSIGSTRLESGSGGDSEVQRTMLELLNQLDGFEPKQNIKVRILANLGQWVHKCALQTQFEVENIQAYSVCLFPQVIMATNRIDILDSALLRPGRIDRKIEFPAPNEEVNFLQK